MKGSTHLMTEGTIWKQVVRFAIPVFLGNLFQQLYNTADSLIVGNFVGSEALAAVSSSGNLIFLFTGLIMGIFMGAGVVIAHLFGAQDDENVSLAIHTTIAFALLAGTALTLAGVIFSPGILRLMGTPENVLPNSILYFRIYFLGSLGVVMYNAISGIFQAMGDSRHPLYYLITSSVLNIALDLLFVVVFKWGIAGAGAATVISQMTSAALGLKRLFRRGGEYRAEVKKLRLDRSMLGEILRMGIPTGLQNSVISLANVVVQSNINVFGAVAMAGCGAYSKIEGFCFLPVTSFTMAITTFVSQNMGAKKPDRAKRGARFGVIACVSMAEMIGALIFIFAPKIIGMFSSDAEVVRYGAMMARTTTLFFCLVSYSHCMAAVLRGCGRSVVPMIVMLMCWCVIRVSYITIIVHFIPDIRCVFWAYPLTWTLSTIVYSLYFIKKKPFATDLS